jgi:predicted transcriptional regulator
LIKSNKSNGKQQNTPFARDVAADQRLADLAALADREETIAAVREGLADVEAGRTKLARAASRALAKKYGINVTGKDK